MKLHLEIDYELDSPTGLGKILDIKPSFLKSRFFEVLPKKDERDQYVMVALIVAYLSLAEKLFSHQDDKTIFTSTLISIQTFMAMYWPETMAKIEKMVEDEVRAKAACSFLAELDPQKFPKA